MNRLDGLIISFLIIYSLMVMASPVYPVGEVKAGDPYLFYINFNPRIVEPYDPVYAVAAIHYAFPYPLPIPIQYVMELDKKAYKPSSVNFYNLPPYPILVCMPRWVSETSVWCYDSGILFRSGSGEMWMSYYTGTAYFYDTHWGAVGDGIGFFPWTHEKSWFYGERLVRW